MTDPDAPNGEGQPGNHTWTHWVITMKNNNMEKVIVPYAPPSPPRGTHKYEFKIYDAMNISNLPTSNNHDSYYQTVLDPIIKIQKPIITKLYTVTV
jgi:phosphatidylethanolamine-binding protein (PEBP) family uncharacterized protein